jgi:schlafen family protein
MTVWQSLLYCAAADVTLGRIKSLVAVTGTEPLTVDFKEGGKTAAIAECAAAMANAEGGLILVGITDQNREMVGVPAKPWRTWPMCWPPACRPGLAAGND